MEKNKLAFETVEEAWIYWLEMFVPKNTSIDTANFIRHTFYGGASAVFAIINNMDKTINEVKIYQKRYKKLAEEINRYFRVAK